MEEQVTYEVSIFEKKRSWYELVLAAVFYSVFIYLLVLLGYSAFVVPSIERFLRAFAFVISIGSYCIVYGLKFSATKNLLIDVDTHLIVSRYIIGPFSYDVKSKVTQFEYVSFFKDRFDYYGTNLWYVKNRHYKMYDFENKEAAYQFALAISNKLNIDLLDATEKGNFVWIEKENRKA
jgi:hypothetical protein